MISRLPTILGLLLLLSHFDWVVAGPVPTDKPASYPNWWFERDVIPLRPDAPLRVTGPKWPVDYPTPDDYAVVNGGQLRHLAIKAAAEFQVVLPAPGAGTDLTTELAKWNATPPERDDYVAVNQGQLKYVASFFYNRLFELGYTGIPLAAGAKYPWTAADTDDDSYALVNLGQLKHVFSFRVPGGSGDAADSDSDGMPDVWEFSYWGVLGRTGSLDFDSDGTSDFVEYRQGRNPLKGFVNDLFGVISLSVHSPTP